MQAGEQFNRRPARRSRPSGLQVQDRGRLHLGDSGFSAFIGSRLFRFVFPPATSRCRKPGLASD